MKVSKLSVIYFSVKIILYFEYCEAQVLFLVFVNSQMSYMNCGNLCQYCGSHYYIQNTLTCIKIRTSIKKNFP